MTDTAATTTSTSERDEVLAILTKHRALFLVTVQGLTDEQARLTPTVSALSLGGLVKHVTAAVVQWLDFIEQGADAAAGIDWDDPAVYRDHAESFRLRPDETLEGVLAGWAAAAGRTDALVASVDLAASRPLPSAPWFAPGEAWSNRRVFCHILAELAQHSGHADILREAIDGQQTMG